LHEIPFTGEFYTRNTSGQVATFINRETSDTEILLDVINKCEYQTTLG